MKKILSIFFILFVNLSFANMASPYREGTYAASAFSSRDIDILREKIRIKVDKNFKTAAYKIEYKIKTDSSGKQIPLLFYAKDYFGFFKIWVDDKEIELLDIPQGYGITSYSPFEKFSNSFNTQSGNGTEPTVIIYWEERLGNVYNLDELKYFETDLTKGEHFIRVEYVADVWTDISDWVTEYSFRYSLSPAQYWKSFGSLEVILDATTLNKPLSTNMRPPDNGKLDSIAVWKFSNLPGDCFNVIYKPQISKYASTLIEIGPEGLTVVLAILLFILHLFLIYTFRKRNPEKKYSWVVIVGSIIIPMIVFIGYMISYDIIDNAIGNEAGGYHGYTFMVFLFYPVVLPTYWLVLWLFDRVIKMRIRKSKNTNN